MNVIVAVRMNASDQKWWCGTSGAADSPCIVDGPSIQRLCPIGFQRELDRLGTRYFS